MVEQKASRKETSVQCLKVLTSYFRKWQLVFPNQPMLPALPVYLEALSDLNPEQMAMGCAGATKRMERFPTPGHIRSCVPYNHEYAGLPALTYPPVSQEERDEAIKAAEPIVAHLRKLFSFPVKVVGRVAPLSSTPRSLQEQKAILRKRGLLK